MDNSQIPKQIYYGELVKGMRLKPIYKVIHVSPQRGVEGNDETPNHVGYPYTGCIQIQALFDHEIMARSEERRRKEMVFETTILHAVTIA